MVSSSTKTTLIFVQILEFKPFQMDKLQTLFTSSFRKEAIDDLFKELEQLNTACADEIFIILNDYKLTLSYSLSSDDRNIYLNNPTRSTIEF